MFRAVAITVIVGGIFVDGVMQVNFVCDGIWKLQNFEKCENPEQYKFDMDVKKRKINRTHDGFTMKSDLPEAVTEDFSLLIETYTKLDGGYKFDQNMADNSLCHFLNEYCKENFEEAMTMAGYDPPNCPIPKGLFELKDYVVNYNRLPPQGKCGEYKSIVYVLQDSDKVGCVIAYTSFSAKDSEDDDDK